MLRVLSAGYTRLNWNKSAQQLMRVISIRRLIPEVGSVLLILFLLFTSQAFAQLDQGAITGVVQDSQGAVIPGAQVTLTNIDTGLVLYTKTSESGIYVFSPIKIGRYEVRASATGFQNIVQKNLQVNIGSRLNVVLNMKTGAVSETITVSGTLPLLQTQSSSVSQEFTTSSLQNLPINQSNWVYLAQLSAGITPSAGKTRGSGTGDFMAGGQRAEQNNFMLDGVDNNTNIVDYMNGSTYAIAPPPEALSEFKIDTADYSAEFGHSAGAVLNASIKSGTNEVHGSLWEYVRNTALNAKDWNAQTIPPYHMNQFGATLGLPIIKNKLFYFGDIQNTRIAQSTVGTFTVPTMKMRDGDFSELLNPSLTGSTNPIKLYLPGTAGATELSCNGQQNVMCANQIDPVAERLLKLYPQPNANGGKTFNNLVENLPVHSNPIQWDQRLDWNVSRKDQAYTRYSYSHTMNTNTPPLGPILDGTSTYAGVLQSYLAENFMLSETHIINPNLINEFRFAYNWGKFANIQANADKNLATEYGTWIPFGDGWPRNGALPNFNVSGIQLMGTHGNDPSIELQNNYQIFDNVTKIAGNHSLKFGINFQNLRVQFLQPPASHGLYAFTGAYTSRPGTAFTGNGVADFLFDQIANAQMTNEPIINDQQWYEAAYLEDNWRVTNKLTLNLGLRYDYFQPYQEQAGLQGNYVFNSSSCCTYVNGAPTGTGTGVYLMPADSKNVYLPDSFKTLLASQNIAIQYIDNKRLSESQKTNFAPRIGIAYQLTTKTVIRSGFGIFYGLIQSAGSNANIGENFPFVLRPSIPQPPCYAYNNPNPLLAAQGCPSLAAQGITIETGFSQQVTQGLANFVPSFIPWSLDTQTKTPYTMNYNLSVQRELTPSISMTISYLGNASRHLMTLINPNTSLAIMAPGSNTQLTQPFPKLSGSNYVSYSGVSTYNSLQAMVEKRYTHGLNFLATYTFAHAMDDSVDPLGGTVPPRNTTIIPIINEFTNSPYDVRHRFTLSGYYDLPFGKGRAFATQSRLLDAVIGGWTTSVTFTAQSGLPFTVGTNGSVSVGGATRAIQISAPYKGGGTANSTNPGLTCPAQVKTRDHWYNPCAFANPPVVQNNPQDSAHPVYITDADQAIGYLGGLANQIYGPGFNRVNMSIVKKITVWREHSLQFRLDSFNALNHPSWANPSSTGINNNGGQITGPVSVQNNTPDARFFQLSMKYVF